MPANLTYISQNERTVIRRSLAEEMGALLALEAEPDRFLAEMLKTQCRLAEADGGVVIRLGKKSGLEFLAVYPQPKIKGVGAKWIATAAKLAREAIDSGKTVIKPEFPEDAPKNRPQRQIIVIPIHKENTRPSVAAFISRAMITDDPVQTTELLEITPFLIRSYEMQWTLGQGHIALDRIRCVLELLAATNLCRHFMSAAMAFCNESAARWHCSRVSLGFLYDRYIRVQAMSHTEKFSRKMKLVQNIEAAMEECLDQDIEVTLPAPADAAIISRSAAQLSKDHGPLAVLSLPLRQDGEVPGVLTLERAPEKPFTPDEIETIRLACDMLVPRLVELREHDRWIGARIAASVRRRMGPLLGPKYTGVKLWVITIFAAAVFLTLAKGEYRVESPFLFESTVHQAIVAPVETFIKSISVAPGDRVEAGKTVLGELDTTELRLKLAALKAEQLGYRKEMAASMRDRNTVESQIAQTQIDKAAAEIRLLEHHIRQAMLVAPISGRIISGDLKRRIGAKVKKGEILYEIASIESLRAELYVPESMIVDVREGQEGELASIGRPGERIGFVVERINPVADVVNQQNVFKVRARLLEQQEWIRPGMEGIAKISAGKKRYLWIGTRRIVNWLRMKLWL
jgi:multidrug resistance efflux pump